MEKNVLIVDESSQQRLKLAKIVLEAATQDGISVKIYKAVNVVRAMQILKKNDIDMLLLNTNYNNRTANELLGIRLVEKLRRIEKYMLLPVIFVSDCQKMREYAYQELNCIGYQPFEFDVVKLNELVKKGLHYTTARDEKEEVYLKEKTLMHPVRVKDIVYIESHSHGLCFRLKSGMALEVKKRTLPDVKEKIKNQCLLQCGRNVIVNRDYIEIFKDNTLILRNGTDSVAIPVGVRFRQVVKMAVL